MLYPAYMPGVSHIDGPAVCGTRQDTIYQLWLDIELKNTWDFICSVLRCVWVRV